MRQTLKLIFLSYLFDLSQPLKLSVQAPKVFKIIKKTKNRCWELVIYTLNPQYENKQVYVLMNEPIGLRYFIHRKK